MKIAAKNAKDREEKNLYPGVPWCLVLACPGGKTFMISGRRVTSDDEPS